MMLRIKNYNTSYWGFTRTSSEPYPCHTKVNAFVGPSGGGKTTGMDALRIALGDARFENNRAMDHYIHPKSNWAVVKVSFWNRKEEGSPFVPYGFTSEEVTVCVRLSNEHGKCDREYYLFDGEFNDIIDLGQNSRLYKKRQIAYSDYMKKLEEIGITRPFRRLMMMRPEDVQNTVDLSPEQLFDRAFDLKGDKAIQNKHDETQDKFRSLRQIEEDTARELLVARQKLDDYEQKQILFENNEKDKEELERITLLYLKRKLWDARIELEHQKDGLDKTVGHRDLLLQEKDELERVLQNMMGTLDIESARKEELQVLKQQAFNEMTLALTNCNKQKVLLEQKSEEINKVKEIAEESLEQLLAEREAILQQFDAVNATLHSLNQQKNERMTRIKMIKSGERVLPDWVGGYQQALKESCMNAVMLADCICVKKEFMPWVEAIEGLLGRERFRTIVLEQDYLPAKKLQEQLEYRARVCLPKAPDNRVSDAKLYGKYASLRSALDVAQSDRVGGYLQYLSGIYLVETVEEGHLLQKAGYKSLTKKGLFQDKEGSMFYKSSALYCGRSAREKYVANLGDELKSIQLQMEALTPQKVNYQQKLEDTQKRINLQKQKLRLPDLQLELESLSNLVLQLDTSYQKAKEQYEGLTEEWSASQERITKHCTEITRKEGELENRIEKIKSAEASIHSYRGSITRCIQSVSEAEYKLLETGYDRNDLEFLDVEVQKDQIFMREDGSEWTRELLEVRKDDLEQRVTVFAIKHPDITPLLMNLVAPQRKQVNGLQMAFDRARSDREEWEIYLAQAKAALRNHVRETMNQYIEEFTDMASLLGAKAWGKFEQEGENYTQWRLHLKLAFDGKELKPYYDPIFSKGQRAAISIMLLLAAVNNRREGTKNGIMFLDEPTSRVDDSRANEIGMILQKTNIQYFITHQITASLEKVEWIDHAFVTSKLREGDNFADDPIFESRRTEGE